MWEEGQDASQAAELWASELSEAAEPSASESYEGRVPLRQASRARVRLRDQALARLSQRR